MPLEASGHYVYRQRSLYVPTVVTICTASGHYMYRQWSLYVLPVVTVCTASGHYMYHQFNIQTIQRSAHTVCLCVLRGSQNKKRLFHCTALTGWFL